MRRSVWPRALGLGAFFGLLVFIMATPAPFKLTENLIGNNVDDWIFYWNNESFERAIEDGRSLLTTPDLFHPGGASLIAHSNSYTSSFLAFLVEALVGPMAAYNLVWLFGIWIGAVGAFLLVRDLTHSSAAALVGGFYFAFAPYHITQALAHAHLGSIHWWPFYVLFLHRAMMRRRIADGVIAGVFFALTFWTGLQLAVLLGLWTVVYLLWHGIAALVRRANGTGGSLRVEMLRALIPLVPLVVVALILSGPLLLLIAREWTGAWTADFDRSGRDQTDLLAYFIPPTYHSLWGEAVSPIYEEFVANRAYMPYVGYVAVLLLLLSLAFLRRNGFWLASLALWLMLAAGASPRIAGVVYEGISLPYAWVKDVFPLSTLRAPDRFNLLVVLTVAVLVGYGAARLRRRLLLIAVVLVLLVEFLTLPLPMWERLPDSPFFDEMARDPSSYAVVDYPMGYTESKLWLYYQTRHGKPMVEGHVSRYDAGLYDFILSHALLRALYQPQVESRPELVSGTSIAGQPVPVPMLGPALRDLTEDDVELVLVHKSFLDEGDREHLPAVLPFAPTFEDEILAVYDLTAPLKVVYNGFPLALSSELILAEFEARPDGGGRSWRVDVLAQTQQLAPEPVTCTVTLDREGDADMSEGLGGARAWPLVLFRPPGATDSGVRLDWQSGDLDYQAVDISLDEALAPGRYRWGLMCEDARPYRDPNTLRVEASGDRWFYRRTMNVRFGDNIWLEGYRWMTEGGTLKLLLWWRATDEPPANLKVFVHLLDGEGRLVEQYDAVPCAWGCPTEGWVTGVPVEDEATLNVAGLPAGRYHLAVGLYDAISAERLEATDADSEVYVDGYLTLPDAFVVTRASQ